MRKFSRRQKIAAAVAAAGAGTAALFGSEAANSIVTVLSIIGSFF